MPKKPSRVKSVPMSRRYHRHDLYQRAVQTVDSEIDFVDETFEAKRGRLPRTLREDFCGTANTSCEFVRRRRTNRAVGVDLDHETLAWGIEHNLGKLSDAARSRIELMREDVRTVRAPKVDAVLAMNFSYYIFKERAELRRYFAHVRTGLSREGLFFLDVYGGSDAFRVMKEKRKVTKHIEYVWDQAEYNPITGVQLCKIHFRFSDGSALKDAFTYEWRLWTLPEIREVLAEAGFRRSTVYWEGWDERTWEGNGDFQPAESADPDPGWISYIVAEP